MLNNIPIAAKFLIVIALFGALSVSSAIFASTKMAQIDTEYTATIAKQGAAALFISRSTSALRASKNAIADLLISKTTADADAALRSIRKERQNLVNLLDGAKTADPSQSEAVEAVKQRELAVIDKICAKTIALGRSAKGGGDATSGQVEYVKTCAPAFGPLTANLKVQVDQTVAVQSAINTKLRKATTSTIILNYVVVLGSTLAVMVFGFFAVRMWVSQPINSIVHTMRRLATGDLSVTVAGADRGDEIGPMAQAVQVFKDNAVKLISTGATADTLRGQTEQDRLVNEAVREQVSQRQGEVVAALGAGLKKLAIGDLTFRVETPFAAEYEVLRADFNAALARLLETMKVVSDNANAMRAGASDLTRGADNMARRTEQQAASLEQTAAALDELTATVKSTADGADHARGAVQLAQADAEGSGDVVNQAIKAMSHIENSAREISNIIGVIDEIAFQTNLLALNAGVEAARAGDSGRGFAVVASEVRALAQRSAEAAKEIKSLILASNAQVETGVKLVSETGTALDRIVAQISEISGIVTEMAASAQEQAAGLKEVNTAINQMDQMTQHNAAVAEQSTAASHAVAEEAEGLAQLIGQFELGRVSPSASRPIAPLTLVKAALVKNVAVAGRIGSITSVVKQDWEEF